MSARSLSSALDRWAPMIAAFFTAVATTFAVLAAVSAHGGYALALMFTALIATNWWWMAYRSLAARETARHLADAMAKVGAMLDNAARTASTSGDAAGMGVVLDFMSDGDMLPPAAEIAAQAGTETAA